MLVLPSNTIKEIVVSFENVEQVTIYSDAIRRAQFGRIEEELELRQNQMVRANHPEKIDIDFNMGLFLPRNLNMRGMHMHYRYSDEENLNTVKEHFYSHRDITSIRLVNLLHNELWIVAPWCEGNPNSNEYMQFIETDEGYKLTIDRNVEKNRPLVFTKKTSVENLV